MEVADEIDDELGEDGEGDNADVTFTEAAVVAAAFAAFEVANLLPISGPDPVFYNRHHHCNNSYIRISLLPGRHRTNPVSGQSNLPTMQGCLPLSLGYGVTQGTSKGEKIPCSSTPLRTHCGTNPDSRDCIR